ncbi:hypothetical protein VPH35_041307 [Triticum aestivum]
MKDAPVTEGEEPKSAAEILDEVLNTEVNQSTFLRNVGLQPSRKNPDKATAAMAAHVHDLEQKLERSELQAEVMQEQLAAIKMKVEEAEAARDKELELLRKKSQEQDEKKDKKNFIKGVDRMVGKGPERPEPPASTTGRGGSIIPPQPLRRVLLDKVGEDEEGC